MQHRFLRLLEHHLDGSYERPEFGRFLVQLLAAGFGQGVKPGTPVG